MSKSDIIQDGKPRFGRWFGEIHNPDPRDYRPSVFSPFYLPFREKRWQYIGLYTKELFLGIALVHTGYIGNVFCYVFDRKRKALWEQERIAPLGAGIRIERRVFSGISSYHTEHERVRIEARQGRRLVDIRLKEKNQDLDVRLELEDTPNPLQIVTPTAAQGFTFTHKGAALKTTGTVRLGTKRWEIHKEKSALDFTFGYPARETSWEWVSAHGTSAEGKDIAINLVSPIFHDQFHENIIWIDKQPISVGVVDISYLSENPMGSWQIQSRDGRLKMVFQPEGRRQQNIQYPLLSSRFIQPFGNFQGSFIDNAGVKHSFTSLDGVVEEHHARW